MSGTATLSEKERRADEPGAKLAGTERGVAAPAHHRVVAMEKARGTFTGTVCGKSLNKVRVDPARNFSGNLRNNFRGEPAKAPAFEMTTAQWNQRSSGAFVEHMNAEGLSLKELAQKIGCSDRTAENYVQGRTAPAGLHFLRAIAVIPEFEAQVRYVSAMITDGDPRAARAAHELQQAAMRFIEARDAARAAEEEAIEMLDPAMRDLFGEPH